MLLVPGCKPKGLIESVPSVRPSVRHAFISETALTIFLKFGMKLGPSNGSNHKESFFKKKYTITPKLFILLQKNTFFEVFCTLRKKCSNDFSKILPKCVNKWTWPFGKILEKSIDRVSHKMHEDMAFFAKIIIFP